MNAADDEKRAEALAEMAKILDAEGRRAGVDVVMHSLAFGTLKPFLGADAGERITKPQMEMTVDVMAHSLVYWMQDLVAGGFLPEGAHAFAMTSAGGHRIWKSYGAVSAAKAALESHCRQLAVELAPRKIAVNAIRAGVTDTPGAPEDPRKRPDDRALSRDSPGRPADDPGRRRERPRGPLVPPDRVALGQRPGCRRGGRRRRLSAR